MCLFMHVKMTRSKKKSVRVTENPRLWLHSDQFVNSSNSTKKKWNDKLHAVGKNSNATNLLILQNIIKSL
jgi:hypothetical protein